MTTASTELDIAPRLAELEAVIERGLATFVEVGLALLEIRGSRLYLETYPSFDAYCRERWGWSRQRGYQLMDAAKVSTVVDIQDERQARELVPLLRQDEHEVVEVWRELKEAHGEKVTADLVRRAVVGRLRYERGSALQSSESNEWYTPAPYVEAAREVMGSIDLDPASHPMANDIVKAARYFTIEEDGLAQSWSGNVWLNPPYGGLSAEFVSRAVEGYTVGRISAATILVSAHATDADWFQPLFSYPLCSTHHRIGFYSSETLAAASGATHGSVFAYLGPHIQRFASVFAKFGAVVRRLEVLEPLEVGAP